jgi:PAS domain-containing protein
MNAVASPSSRPVQPSPNPHPVPSWEFTRRKRWADLIATELSEAIVLVLSPRRKVLYCNPSVREMLGWLDDDLVDMDFTELVNGLYLPLKFPAHTAHHPFCSSSE